MGSSETLRARVDRAMAKRVAAWAKKHDTDVSGTIRTALTKLLDEADRATRMEEHRRRLHDAFDAGLFDPPKDGGGKASGGWK